MGCSLKQEKISSEVLKHGAYGSIELVDTQKITQKTIDQVYQIEQDLWARYLGEYLQCTECSKVYSKEDIFSEELLSAFGLSIQKNTVSEIEACIGSGEKGSCDDCDSQLSPIFGSSYRDEISSRYDFESSYLLLHRSFNGRILGFVDAYVGSFDTIYERELQHYYGESMKAEVQKRGESILKRPIPERVICLSGVGNTPDSASMKNLYELEKAMVEVVAETDPDIVGVYESVIGSCAHMILEVCKAQRLGFSDQGVTQSHDTVTTDIFIHDGMAREGVLGLGNTFKEFYKKNRKIISKLRN